MPTSSQRISPVRRVEDVAPTPLSLDPVSCQSMVSRLYTPDLVRQRRMISAAQDAEERRVKGEYDATRDMHLANYWHRQQEVKRTLRCFAKNAGPHRAATPGTIHHTTVHEVSSDMSSANRSAILPPLSSKQTSAAGSPTLRHSDGAPVAKTPVVQPPSPASSRASSRSSSRSSDTYHSPEASIVAASQQGSLAPSPSKRSQRSAEYSSDYDDDFSPTTSEAPTSPPKKQEEPTGSEKPAEARPQPSPDAQRPQRTESALAVTQTTDAANESHQVDPLSREDLATLVMIVRPSSNFAASVRRLGIHDGFDLGWIDGPKLTRPKLVTLLDIPMNPASSAEEPTNNNTTTNTSTGGAAGDPQLDGERPRTQRRSGASPTPSAATPANPDITSPRSILLMLRNSVAPADLWPVSYNDHAQAELKRGSSRTVIRHRYELREATRRATLETLRRQYAELSSQAELESIVMQLRRGAKRRSERENSLQVSRLMNDPDDDVSGTGASSHGNKTSNSSGVSSYTAKHEKRRLRLEKQFSTAMDIERMRTGKMVQRHEKELRCDETLRQKREREARERAEKGRQRDEHVQTTVDAATQLLQTKVTKLQMEQEYLEKRSDQAKERAHVENLAKMEYQLALREERLRLVAAHERRQEYEKLQLLQAAQHRQDCINDMIMKREMERRRVLEERKQQELRLEAAANKLQSDLLALKRKQLQPAAAGGVTPARAKSALR